MKMIPESQRFAPGENKGFSSVFSQTDQQKFKVRLAMQPLKNFKAVWTYLTSQETTLKFMNVIVSSAKNLKTESFAFERRDWIIFVQVSRFEKCHCNPQHRQH